MVILKNITTGYPGVPVTTDITATLRPGEFTCLLGPNGAGKSTLLKTLCAFIKPLEGSITIDGQELNKASSRFVAEHIGVVLTDRPSATDMKVSELVSLGRTPYTGFFGTLSSSDHRIVENSIDMVGIRSLASRRVATLSDGERQKAMIAKALAQQTPLILLDEPTAFLDYPGKIEIMRLLRRLAREEGKCVFMSTHDLELALDLSDTIWLLDKSAPMQIGHPLEADRRPPLSATSVTNNISFRELLLPRIR